MLRAKIRAGILASAFLCLAACGAETPSAAPAAADPLIASLSDSDRPAADRDDDDLRKPGAVMAFTGIEPGMKVYEMEAGRGYYTEIMSRIVGETGTVVMQNPASFESFAGDDIAARLADGRLANVERRTCNFDDLKADDATFDIVTWFLGPHELYFRPPGVESFGDPQGAFAEAYRILKPGGSFVILDHAAPAGSPVSTGNTLHRIDPAVVKGFAEDAGFELVDESDVLRNVDDQYDLGVFDAAVRRKTDRFLLKYRKPELS